MTSISEQSRAGLRLATFAAIGVVALTAFLFVRGPASPAAPGASPVPASPVAGVASTPAADTGADDAFALVTSSAPEGDALGVLALKYGVLCTNASDVTVREDPAKLIAIDEAISKVRLGVGWVEQDQVFKGEAAAAAKAFGAAEAYASGSTIWIVVPGKSAHAVELREQITPGGNQVWEPRNWAMPC